MSKHPLGDGGIDGVSVPSVRCRRRRELLHRKLALLSATLLTIFLFDRALFLGSIRLGAIWKSDPVLQYEHRPGVVSHWGTIYDNKVIRINSHGYHDDEFAEAKPAGELRGLFIGDSIVMGHGVTASETFVNQLEASLRHGSSDPDRSFQMINAGVQGYSTSQYLEAFKRARRFSPDFLVVGFCMNDLTEPLVVDKRRGGRGLDYHLVTQEASPWLDFVTNETGFGQGASFIRLWIDGDDLRARWMAYGFPRMVEGIHTDPEIVASWDAVLRDLEAIYTLALQIDLPVLLVIFPEVPQLQNERLQEPQRILKRHAESHHINCLDITEVAERHLASSGSVSDLFLDSNHYTVRGHAVIADELLRCLAKSGYLGDAIPSHSRNSVSLPSAKK